MIEKKNEIGEIELLGEDEDEITPEELADRLLEKIRLHFKRPDMTWEEVRDESLAEYDITGDEDEEFLNEIWAASIDKQTNEKLSNKLGLNEQEIKQFKSLFSSEYLDEGDFEFDETNEAGNAERLEFFRSVVQSEPQNAQAHYNLGVAFDQNDQMDEAITAYEKAIEINSNHAEAHYNLGQNYLFTNQFQKAETSLSAACQIAREFAPAHFMLGVVFAAQGKFREAVAATERGLEFAPEDPMAHFNIGKSLYALGEFEKAAEVFEKVCEYAPDFPDAFYLLGKCYREIGEKEDEFDAYSEAVEIAPDFADAMFALGTVYAHLTETPEGKKVKYFESDGELNLDDARIFFYMGLAQLALGNVETVVERQPELREMDDGLAEQLKFFIDYFN